MIRDYLDAPVVAESTQWWRFRKKRRGMEVLESFNRNRLGWMFHVLNIFELPSSPARLVALVSCSLIVTNRVPAAAVASAIRFPRLNHPKAPPKWDRFHESSTNGAVACILGFSGSKTGLVRLVLGCRSKCGKLRSSTTATRSKA